MARKLKIALERTAAAEADEGCSSKVIEEDKSVPVKPAGEGMSRTSVEETEFLESLEDDMLMDDEELKEVSKKLNKNMILKEMQKLRERFLDGVISTGISVGSMKSLFGVFGEVEQLVFGLVADKRVLQKEVELLNSDKKMFKQMLNSGGINMSGICRSAGPVGTSAPSVPSYSSVVGTNPAARASFSAPNKPPVQTYSVVVKPKDSSVSSKSVVEKVLKEVAPALGVRIHDVKPLKAGGAVLRTPTVSERRKVVENSKFEAAGLDVSVRDKLGPRIILTNVDGSISKDQLFADLHELNLKDAGMSVDHVRKSARIVRWHEGVAAGSTGRVVLEVTSRVAEEIMRVGRVYCMHYHLLARLDDVVPSCYRCAGFDHMVSACRLKDEVCRRCGQIGHRARNCQEAISCRSCKLRGLPSAHQILSLECPVYKNLYERACARH